MRRWIRWAVIGLGIVVIAIQFLPIGPPRDNPPVTGEPHWDTPQTRALFQRSCGDCHSNETRWPWYSYIAPMSWYVAEHVQHGRREFNVSEWSAKALRTAGEAKKEMEHDKMPLPSYLRLHPEARLDAEEESTLVRGITATLARSATASP